MRSVTLRELVSTVSQVSESTTFKMAIQVSSVGEKRARN